MAETTRIVLPKISKAIYRTEMSDEATLVLWPELVQYRRDVAAMPNPDINRDMELFSVLA